MERFNDADFALPGLLRLSKRYNMRNENAMEW